MWDTPSAHANPLPTPIENRIQRTPQADLSKNRSQSSVLYRELVYHLLPHENTRLPDHCTIQAVATEFDISNTAASGKLNTLLKWGILEKDTTYQRNRYSIKQELLAQSSNNPHKSDRSSPTLTPEKNQHEPANANHHPTPPFPPTGQHPTSITKPDSTPIQPAITPSTGQTRSTSNATTNRESELETTTTTQSSPTELPDTACQLGENPPDPVHYSTALIALMILLTHLNFLPTQAAIPTLILSLATYIAALNLTDAPVGFIPALKNEAFTSLPL